MGIIALLIILPLLFSGVFLFLRKQSPLRDLMICIGCALLVFGAIYYAISSLFYGDPATYLYHTAKIDLLMLIAEIGVTGLIIYFCLKYKKYWIALLCLAQFALIAWLDITGKSESSRPHLFSDYLSIIMAIIIGVIGCLICIYAVGYMKRYHQHHKEVQDRTSFFFGILFVFFGAMFGLIFSDNLVWMYFFWEITSVCSFLLIGYTKTKEAIHNAFRALWMNLLGGLGFAIAIAFSILNLEIWNLSTLVADGTMQKFAAVPITLLAFAGLTKSAQLPFSKWLLGAMVAPTPTSALLHSATMVKAGVFLLIRLSPALHNTVPGLLVTTIGGFTFLAASLLAISQSDAKKVLAYSTIANLGLITACAGVGVHESAWAGVFLLMFHAVSKSLMFLSVGSVENSTGSRNIEDMHGLIVKLPELAFVMIIGIAGMFLAPFGMLISKWAALKAFIDTKSILLIVFLIYGSAATLFYWTKWLGKLVAVIHNSERLPNTTGKPEWVSLICHAVLMVALCVTFPFVSFTLVEPLMSDMFWDKIDPIISSGNIAIMMIMLCAIVILPLAVRLLTFGKKHKIVASYMGGVNAGDDRHFINSFGEKKPMYLANWYMQNYFGEQKLLNPVLAVSTSILALLMLISFGGVFTI